MSLPSNSSEASSGPWPQARTLSPATTLSPAATGRWTRHVTLLEDTSQPSETNFQYSSPVSDQAFTTFAMV